MLVLQDATHLVMAVGAACCFLMLASSFYVIKNIGGSGWHFLEAIIIVLLVGPNFLYILRTLQQYDEGLMARERAIELKKKGLIDEYECLVEDIDSLLGKATQSSATLAEGGFESKRRDFIRFLDRCEERAQNFIFTQDVDECKLVEQFKAFIKHWLGIFAECSVDPINRPKYVLTEDELNPLMSIHEVANLCKDRLKCTEVRFISHAREQDSKMLRGFRATHRRLSNADQQMQMLQNGDDPDKPPVVIEMAAGPMKNNYNNNDVDEPPAAKDSERGSGTKKPELDSACHCTWMKFGAFQCGTTRGPNTGYPWSIMCKCCKLMILSSDHMFLMLGCIGAIAHTVWAVTDVIKAVGKAKDDAAKNSNTETHNDLIFELFLTAGYLVCVFMLLVRFESIDVIQQLEREIRRLNEEKEKLSKRREQMVNFWADMQSLTDIWVLRTNPRLDLMKEVHVAVEDIKDPKHLLQALANINTRVDALEKALPSLEHWRRDSQMTEEQKKHFAQQVKQIYQHANQDLPAILTGISNLCQDGHSIPQIKDAYA